MIDQFVDQTLAFLDLDHPEPGFVHRLALQTRKLGSDLLDGLIQCIPIQKINLLQAFRNHQFRNLALLNGEPPVRVPTGFQPLPPLCAKFIGTTA